MNENDFKQFKREGLEYAIGVVTYAARFDEFFVPLIEQLVRVFPDREIICILNGHHDKLLQIDYLKHATAFLSQFPNIRYVTYESNQSLAKCWNWLIMMSFATRTLILNDDINVNLLFRREFEKYLLEYDDFFTINKSWSHFLISKKIVREIGWFEERLLGVGQEDGDYNIRMINKGKKISDVACLGVINYVAPQSNAGWSDVSTSIMDGKYTSANVEFINKKYSFEKNNPNGILRSGMETPIFYNFSCLENSGNFKLPIFTFMRRKRSPYTLVLLPVFAIYGYARKFCGRIYRYFKKY
jgi:hypothetical protein